MQYSLKTLQELDKDVVKAKEYDRLQKLLQQKLETQEAIKREISELLQRLS